MQFQYINSIIGTLLTLVFYFILILSVSIHSSPLSIKNIRYLSSSGTELNITATLELDQYDFHNAIKATNNEFRVIKYD
jgi:hypothetical protein